MPGSASAGSPRTPPVSVAVAQVAVPVPLPRLFDYLAPEGQPLPAIGSRVLIPFGRRRLIGLVAGHGQASAGESAAMTLRPMERVLDEALIPAELLELLGWAMRYWVFAPGEMVNLLLPGALRRIQPFRASAPVAWQLTAAGRQAGLERAPRQAELRKALLEGPRRADDLRTQCSADAGLLGRMHKAGWIEPLDHLPVPAARPGPELNAEQRHAVAAVLASRHRFSAFLLSGVTSSGKTEVYLRIARRLIRAGRQVLILAPEIGLAPQLVRRMEERLGHKAWLYHSGLSEGERLASWQAARSGRARVLVGTRSAVFLPLARPGLIVVDESHDASFKQNDGARYHGRDLAVLRASRLGIPIVLGTATPSLESLYNVEEGRYHLLRLRRRAGEAQPPQWRIIDQRGHGAELAPALVESMRRHLEAGGQVLIYRNRRGYAPVLMCSECGWQADCERCSAHLTWHLQGQRLKCHHCGSERRQPPRCPQCQSPALLPLGAGTERLEEQLSELFPETPVHRVDRDVMQGRHAFEELLQQVRAGEPCILVGTQMLAKGHHLPGVSLAAVLDVDQSLFSADFRAPEQLCQVVSQVAGRAGRGAAGGEFLLLTRHPEHPLIEPLLQGVYEDWARPLLAERRAAELPPASALAMLRAESHQSEAARKFLQEAAALLAAPGLHIIGPLAAILARRGGYWRYQLWLQADARSALSGRLWSCLPALHELKSARQVRWHVDVDPLEL